MATLVWTDGKLYEVPEERLQEALQSGFSQPTQEQLARSEARQQPVQAGLEGVARGVSFGLSDPMLLGTGLVTREGLRLRREENPLAATVGEVGGAVGAAFLPGGGAARLAGGGIRGATVEAGLYGLGSVVSEATLENKELTAERLAAGMAGGALAGGALATAAKGVTKAVSATTKALGGKSLGTVLQEAGKEAEWRTLAQKNKKLARINEPLKDEIVEKARTIGVNALDENAVALASAERDRVGAEIGGAIEELQRLKPLDDKERGKLIGAVETALDNEYGNQRAIYGPALDGMKKQFDEVLQSTGSTWADIWAWQSNLFKKLPRDPNLVIPAEKEVVSSVRQTIRDYVMDDVAAKVLPARPMAGVGPQAISAGLVMRRLGKEYKVASALEEMLESRVNALESSAGPLDIGGAQALVAGAIGTAAGGGNLLAGAAAAVAARQFERRGGFLVGRGLQMLGSATVPKAAQQLQQRISAVLASNPTLLGKFALPLIDAGAQGAEALLEEHARIASGPDGDFYLATLGMHRETPEEVAAASHRMAVLDALDSEAKAHKADVDSAVSGFFGSRPGPKPAVKPLSRADYEERLGALKNLVTNNQGIFDAIPSDFLGMAPETSGLMGQKLGTAAQYLLSKAPRSPWEDKPAALQQPWKPSDADLARWYRHIDAVEDPYKVVERMRAGDVAVEHLDALQAVYPQIFESIKQSMAERLMLWEKPLTWDKRQILAKVLGPEVLATPQQVSILQAVHGKTKQAKQGAGGPDGRQQVDMTKNMQTQAQRMEAR